MSSATELRHQLRAGGYAPIPLYGKEPPAYGKRKKNNERGGLNGWQKLTDVSAEQTIGGTASGPTRPTRAASRG